MESDTADAVIHRIHGSGVGSGQGQDQINPSGVGTPVTIDGGSQNPNAALRNVTNISRSASVVSVPVYDGQTNLCPSPGACVAPQQKIIGFLRLGIQQVQNSGDMQAVIMNAVGCNPNNTGNNVVSGGGITAVPVRLVQ
jgi:hypothetical protein